MNSQTPPENFTQTPPPQPERIPVAFKLPVGKPWATYTIIAVTVLIFGAQQLSQYLTSYDLPFIFGGKINQFILRGEVWRLFTPIFLHGSILHIAFNMYALFTIGPGLERHYGHNRFLILYFLCGYTGNVLSFLLTASPSLGASTAVFGLVAAEVVFIYQNRTLFGQRARSMLLNLFVVIAINFVFGLQPNMNIDNWGHLGGLAGGLIFAWFAGPRYKVQQTLTGLELKDSRTSRDLLWACLCSAGLFSAAVIGRFIAG